MKTGKKKMEINEIIYFLFYNFFPYSVTSVVAFKCPGGLLVSIKVA